MTEDKRFTFSDVWGWRIDGFLNVMNGLDRKNNEFIRYYNENTTCLTKNDFQIVDGHTIFPRNCKDYNGDDV